MEVLKTGRYQIEVHKEQAVLYHYTDAEKMESIRKKGILPSAFGDLDIDGVIGTEDGSGVYAVAKETGHDALVGSMKLDGSKVVIVKFLSCGTWYKVIHDYAVEYYDEDEDEPIDHRGYVLHPSRVPPANILGSHPV